MSNNIKNKVSSCCSAPLIVRGDSERGGLATNHYECTKCGQACDEKAASSQKSTTKHNTSSEKKDWREEAQRLYFEEGVIIDDWFAFIKKVEQDTRRAALEEAKEVIDDMRGCTNDDGKCPECNEMDKILSAIDKLIKET